MADNVKDAKHSKHIAIRMNFVLNGKECNVQKTFCYGGGM